MTSAPGGAAQTEEVGSSEQIADEQSRLDRAQEQLASFSDCRDICRATGDICVAAQEICGMTGDRDNPSPNDSRCVHARAACDQASRQRNGACPVCPTD